MHIKVTIATFNYVRHFKTKSKKKKDKKQGYNTIHGKI